MMSSLYPEQQSADLIAVEQACQDHAIGKRLPAWLRSATAEQLAILRRVMHASLQLRQEVAKLLQRIEPIDAFVRARLQSALQAQLSSQPEIDRWRFVTGYRVPVINSVPVGWHLTEVEYRQVPLLEAALSNFTADEAQPGGQPKGNCLLHEQGSAVALSATEFARLCRKLDLGGQYQRHLDKVLREGATDALALLADWYRYGMLMDAFKARSLDVFDETLLGLVVGLCLEPGSQILERKGWAARQLVLLGCRLEQIMVIEQAHRGKVLLHVPGDPHGAWGVFASRRQLANELGRRLRSKAYQQFFRRFVRNRDEPHFYGVVTPTYEDLAIWANIDLQERLATHFAAPFETLAHGRIAQIKDDAAMIAVPVARLDREQQLERERRIAAAGQTLSYLASFFVPGLGELLLAVSAWEVLCEVYQGLTDWREGEVEEALDHLLNVAGDLAVMGATAVGVGVARRAWQRSRWVDSLVPAHLEDGRVKLWRPDLSRFRRDVVPVGSVRDAEGVDRHAGQAWVEMDGAWYSVRRHARETGWQLTPYEGHGPSLHGNGQGAWRLYCEQPGQWVDASYLLRRLGRPFAGLDEEQAAHALMFHGLDADYLRAVHVYGQVPDAGLLDSVLRIHLDLRIRAMIGRLRSGQPVEDLLIRQHAERLPGASGLPDPGLAELAWRERRRLFQQIYDSQQSSDNRGVQALRRVFPGLHREAARALLEAADLHAQARLLESGRVSFDLAQAARMSVSRIRLARVYEALYLDTPQGADLARVVLGLLKHLPAQGVAVRWRLFEGHVDGPLLSEVQAGATAFDLVHRDGQFLLLDAHGQPVGEPGELFEVMASAYGHELRVAMGINDPFAHNFRVLLARVAVQRRDEVEQLLRGAGQRTGVLLPQRLGVGRLGYPLSGRGAAAAGPQFLRTELRTLYPGYTDAQIETWVAQVRQAGDGVLQALDRLRAQLMGLRVVLEEWVSGPPVSGRSSRRRVMNQLLARWQRITDNAPQYNLDEGLYSVSLDALRPGMLPSLPEDSFAHVAQLSLSSMDLPSVPLGFLRAFPNLRVLRVSHNRLARLPPNLERLEHLHTLDAQHNQIALVGMQIWNLEHCPGLRQLNLSSNPLGSAFSLARMSQLADLRLRNTGIDQLPPGLLECQALDFADLRDNRIHRLPAAFYQARSRYVVLLAGNPLGQEDVDALRLFGRAGEYDSDGQRWGDPLIPEQRNRMIELWGWLDTQEGAAGIVTLFQRLLHTPDFERQPRALAWRVLHMLESVQADGGLREALFAQVDDELSCDDSAIWRFSNLEVQLLAMRARTQALPGQEGQALLHLGQQLWRLDQVDQLVYQHLQQHTGLDQINVVLGYRQRLREVLDLPVEPVSLRHAEVAVIDEQWLEQIIQRVAALREREAAEWMIDLPFWRRYLAQAFGPRFEAANAPYHESTARFLEWRESLAAQDAQPDPEADAARRARLRELDAAIQEEHRRQRVSERDLLLQLTLEAMESGPGEIGAVIDVR